MTIVTLDRPAVDLDGMRLPLLCDGAAKDEELLVATLHALDREALWREAMERESPQPRMHPGHYLRYRLEASYIARIIGMTTLGVRDHLRLTDEPEWKGTKADPTRTRSRSADRVISTGDEEWAGLGAWPYAVFGVRRLPLDWRHRPETSEALAEYVRRACRDPRNE